MDKYVIFHIDGGAGKSVVATAVCASIKNAYPDHKLIVVTAWPEVFLHNPLVYRVYKTGQFSYFYEDFVKDKDSVVLRTDPYHHTDFINKKNHLVQVWCDLFGIKCTQIKPQIFLTQRELINASKLVNKQGPILLMQISGGADGQETDYSWARDIPLSIAQDLVNTVQKDFNKILHIRRENQPKLEGVIQVTDNLRNLFCYTYLADKFILIDSVIQHVAAALDKKAVVAWISNSPTVFGYSTHINIGPQQSPNYRHMIDSYLEDYDWIGRRLYECPYDDIDNLFNKQIFLDYLKS
jgi:ADP-heptose:LPS heptosyltransferase